MERALGLRRGRPFADLDEVFVDVEVRRVEGRHLLARRTLAEARLAQGRAEDVDRRSRRLLAEQPLDEAVAGALMTALGALRSTGGCAARVRRPPPGTGFRARHRTVGSAPPARAAPVGRRGHRRAGAPEPTEPSDAAVVVRRTPGRDRRDHRSAVEARASYVDELRRGRQDAVGDRGRGPPRGSVRGRGLVRGPGADQRSRATPETIIAGVGVAGDGSARHRVLPALGTVRSARPRSSWTTASTSARGRPAHRSAAA